ncbi:MAG: class II aldolase/adducin family protein [Fimbriimonadaceae bacterium]|nr:class II aldolase/adducin family protein [Chitinophagales bacterium]
MINLPEEGYIKYSIAFHEEKLDRGICDTELIECRNTLHQLKLIGVYPDGVGYGNISRRSGEHNQFVISGTQTGNITSATEDHFSLVSHFEIKNNSLTCSGKVKASSEALTHAAFYEAYTNINAVIHVHHFLLWKKLLHIISTTDEKILYGTPAMANAVKRLLQTEKLQKEKILVMAGHSEGIFTFGNSLQEAFIILMQYFESKYY